MILRNTSIVCYLVNDMLCINHTCLSAIFAEWWEVWIILIRDALLTTIHCEMGGWGYLKHDYWFWWKGLDVFDVFRKLLLIYILLVVIIDGVHESECNIDNVRKWLHDLLCAAIYSKVMTPWTIGQLSTSNCIVQHCVMLSLVVLFKKLSQQTLVGILCASIVT